MRKIPVRQSGRALFVQFNELGVAVNRLVQNNVIPELDAGNLRFDRFLSPWDLTATEGDVDVTISTSLRLENGGETDETLSVTLAISQHTPEVFLGNRLYAVQVPNGEERLLYLCTRFVRALAPPPAGATPVRVSWIFEGPPADCTCTIEESEVDFSRWPTGEQTDMP